MSRVVDKLSRVVDKLSRVVDKLSRVVDKLATRHFSFLLHVKYTALLVGGLA